MNLSILKLQAAGTMKKYKARGSMVEIVSLKQDIVHNCL